MKVVKIQDLRLRRAEQVCEEWPNGEILLAAGLENAEPDALGAGASLGAVAAPYFPRDHHGTNGLFGAPVRRLQTGTVEESEQRVALPPEMIRQALIERCASRLCQQVIHVGFQLAARHRQPVLVGLVLVATLAQSERRLQNRSHRTGKLRGPASSDLDHLATGAQQMGPAALTHRSRKLPIDCSSSEPLRPARPMGRATVSVPVQP